MSRSYKKFKIYHCIIVPRENEQIKSLAKKVTDNEEYVHF